jgi:hypothetical protein
MIRRDQDYIMRYFFDFREGDEVTVDEEGREFKTIKEVQEEAARSLADMARDLTLKPGGNGDSHELAIEVRDANGPVLRGRFDFEVERWRSAN